MLAPLAWFDAAAVDACTLDSLEPSRHGIDQPRASQWLITTLLTATWAALIWSATILFASGVPEFDEAQRTLDDRVRPLEQQLRTSRSIASLTDSVVGRSRSRSAAMVRLSPDTVVLQQRGLTKVEQASRAHAARSNADSAAVDSAIVASTYGRPLTATARWGAGEASGP